MAKTLNLRTSNATLDDDGPTTFVGPEKTERVASIKIALIDPNPFQPRASFTEQEIYELAQSIEANGLIQPIRVMPSRTETGRYWIVTGERRLRAHQLLGLKKIAALVSPLLTDQQLAELALIENVQRVNLNPIEEAIAYDSLIVVFGYTQLQISTRVSKDQSMISRSLQLLTAPLLAQEACRAGLIEASKVLHMRGLSEAEAQYLIDQITLEGMTREAVKDYVQAAKADKQRKASTGSATAPKAKKKKVEKEEREEPAEVMYGTYEMHEAHGMDRGTMLDVVLQFNFEDLDDEQLRKIVLIVT